jgi:MarR family transcriptional regulator, negative regulator of the multidrug operon emrRAB
MTHNKCSPPRPEIEQIMSDIFGMQNTESLTLFRKLKLVSLLMDKLVGELNRDDKLSHARMRLLMRLEVSSRLGNDTGLTPSEISEYLGVSRNTVSALLNGLEEQALIERALHPTDRRQFLIRLSSTGHNLIHDRAPAFAKFVANLFNSLTPDEQNVLAGLLNKLLDGLLEQADVTELYSRDSA